MVKHLYSDNGSADNVMRTVYGQLQADYGKLIAPKLASQRTTWHFNPLLSHNFGEPWESNVKSVNHHLKRVIADRRLNYEKLSTVLVSIEACLNSRPLIPLTADADDLKVFTLAHNRRLNAGAAGISATIQETMIRHF